MRLPRGAGGIRPMAAKSAAFWTVGVVGMDISFQAAATSGAGHAGSSDRTWASASMASVERRC